MMSQSRQSQPGRGGLSRMVLLFVLVLSLLGCARQGIYHRVEPGQTLYRISKTYNVDEAYLARINGIPNPTQLRVGARVFIPGATSKKYVPATVPGFIPADKAKPVKTRVTVAASPIAKPRVNPPGPSAERKPTSGIATTHKPKSKPEMKLHWPLRGKILKAFGESGKGGGKGLEIAAREGSSVGAAAAGKVIYSGTGVQGFGHLMIIQHENDVFTVYGFNSLNLVKQGQFVSQGEKIASSGRPPSGETGRLHFEVRVGKMAVDPILYLP